MNPHAPDLSILISNHNTRTLLEPCLRSVLDDVGRSGLQAEVIVVDDNSADGSADMVAASFPAVILIRSDRNQGYARANNVGLARASGRAVLLLNSDTIVGGGALRALFAAFEGRADIGAVGPVLVNPDGSLQRSCWPFPLRALIGNSLLLFRIGLWDDYRSWDHRSDRVVDCISSAALLIRREALKRVGVLDEQFWVYGVDIDWALRARRKGYKCLSISGARVVHYGGASWQGMTEKIFADNVASHERLYRKHYGVAGYVFFRGLLLVNSLVRLAFWHAVCALGARRYRYKVDHFKRHLQWALRT